VYMFLTDAFNKRILGRWTAAIGR